MEEINIGTTYPYVPHLHIRTLCICNASAFTCHMHIPGAMINIPDMRHISTLSRESIMRTESIFKNGKNRAIRLPSDLDFEGGERAGERPGSGPHHPAPRPADMGLVRAAGKSRPGLYGGA